MLGDGCMIAPVYEQNARGRHVYLPEDMLMVRFRAWNDIDLVRMPKGHHFVRLQLNEFPLFIRRGHVIPMVKPAEYVAGLNTQELSLLGWLDQGTAITLYEDDGESTQIDLNAGLTVIDVQVQSGKAIAKAEGKQVDTALVVVG